MVLQALPAVSGKRTEVWNFDERREQRKVVSQLLDGGRDSNRLSVCLRTLPPPGDLIAFCHLPSAEALGFPILRPRLVCWLLNHRDVPPRCQNDELWKIRQDTLQRCLAPRDREGAIS
jgi:hypothetical protein